MKGLVGQKILLTGVSSGFGYLLCQKLLTNNYFVIAVLRGGEERGRKIFYNFISYIDSHRLIFLDCDLSDPKAMEDLEKSLNCLLADGLDILVNNAGYSLLGPVETMSNSQIHNQFEVNFFAPVRLIQICLNPLRAKKGKIINISSLAGFTVFPFYGIYSASKHALDAFTEGLFYELSGFGIQVCAVAPGGFKTEINKSSKFGEKKLSLYQLRLENFMHFLVKVQNKIEKNPDIVVNKIFKLCEASQMPVRCRIGIDAHINWILKKIVPDFIRVTFQNWFYKKLFF